MFIFSVIINIGLNMVGLEAGIHVFLALLALLTSSISIGLLLKGSPDIGKVKLFVYATTVLVWLTWFTVAPVYVFEYGVDKAVIKSFSETIAAHAIGMESKEHLFYTGLILSTLTSFIAYGMESDEGSRKLLLISMILLLIGGIILESVGGWISMSAKIAWMLRAGGG